MSAPGRQLLTSIRRIIHAVDSHSKRVERAVGLTVPQLVVLEAVRDLGEVTSSRVSTAVSLSPATVTPILDKLEARGLVERYRSTVDRRVVHARLTEAGERALAAAPFLDAGFTARIEALPAAEQAALVKALDTIVGLMDERIRPPEPGPVSAASASA